MEHGVIDLAWLLKRCSVFQNNAKNIVLELVRGGLFCPPNYSALQNAGVSSFAGEATRLGGVYGAVWSRGDSLVCQFVELERFVLSMRLMRRGLCHLAPSPELYSRYRQRSIISHAVISAVHYILGIGDRHMGNFLLDTQTGEFVGIDFGYAFGVTTVILPIPEIAPIRLTASLRELMEPAGPAGQFGVSLAQTLSALRDFSDLFFSTLQTFIGSHSTHEWISFAKQIGQSEDDFLSSRLALAHDKLIGRCPAALLVEDLRLRFGDLDWFSDKLAVPLQTTFSATGAPTDVDRTRFLTPAEQTRRLVCLASCPEVLSRMHIGWHAFL